MKCLLHSHSVFNAYFVYQDFFLNKILSINVAFVTQNPVLLGLSTDNVNMFESHKEIL